MQLNSPILAKKPSIQPKLTINSPGDKYEQEADAMADRVMRKANKNTHQPTTGIIGASVQRKCASCEEEGKKRVMRKETTGFGTNMQASSSLVSSINSSKGGGGAMPSSTLQFMEGAFSKDFSNVRIHNDNKAAQMSRDINARAFTYGNDIYFNSGEYQPYTETGKHLLAHELTHTVQQGGIGRKIQRQDIDEISTPVPEDFQINRDRRERVTSATGNISGVNITLRPDNRGGVPRGSSGVTRNSVRTSLPRAAYSPTVTSITPANFSISIRSTYRRGIDTSGTSGYGRGTTAADQSSGNTSLRFHEGSHGTRILDFLRENPLPEFAGSTGMTRTQFDTTVREFTTEIREYNQRLQDAQIQDVDCVGEEASFCE